MADRSAFGEEEWAAMLRAPFLVGLLIASASPSGMLGSVKEAFAAKKLLVETRANAGGNALVDLLLEDLDTDEGRAKADLMHLAALSPADARKEAERALKAAGDAARAHAPEEAPGLCEWLLILARTVAEASKEGSFLGIGGKLVSDEESAAVDTVRMLLSGA